MRNRIARYHNIFGPEGTWDGGKEKAPAAICRKVAEVADNGEIEIWGDGNQTRSFLYIDECIEGTTRLLRSRVRRAGEYRIGGDGDPSISWSTSSPKISGKRVHKKPYPWPGLGVRGPTPTIA